MFWPIHCDTGIVANIQHCIGGVPTHSAISQMSMSHFSGYKNVLFAVTCIVSRLCLIGASVVIVVSDWCFCSDRCV